MDKTKKTSLDEAKASFEEIKKFATEAAKKEFENELNEKVDKILKESLSVDVDDENNVTIATDEKIIDVTNNGEVEVEEKPVDDEISISNDDDEAIEIEKNIDEMITFEQEQAPEAAPVDASIAPSPEAIPGEAPVETPAEAPVEEPVDDDVLKLAKLIDTIIDKKVSGDAGTEQGVDVDYIDDETSAAAPAVDVPPAPAPAPAAPPMEEDDDLLEFSLEEIKECGMGEGEMLEFNIPEEKENNYFEIDVDENPEAMLQAAGDIDREPEWKQEVPSLDIPLVNEEELEEVKMKGQSYATQRGAEVSTGPENAVQNRGRQNGVDNVPHTRLEESENKIKAQYESKIDELSKENKRLNESNKEFGEVIKNYQESFKDLRKQFDEMQTFNAKLAYANKIFASGGLSTTDKAKIAEEFDKTTNVDEAKKLYNKILEENKIVVNKDNSSKLKAPTTNTIKGKDVVFESAEMKRRKVLAGIDKNEDC